MAVQLSARGQQDVYVTGKPSMTYFSTIFKKSTPFVNEYIEFNFDNVVLNLGSSRCTLPPRGDMITDIVLKFVFPSLYNISSQYYCYPVLPVNLPTLRVYVISGGSAILAFQAAQFSYYFSTYNLVFWATPYLTDMTISYDTINNKFVFTSTNAAYTALAFADEASASFFGFDILNPSSFLGQYYTYPISSSQLTLVQAGWIIGLVPSTSGFNYVSQFALKMLREARLIIGGQIVSRLTGDYLSLDYDVNVPYENQAGLTALVGKNDTSTKYAPTTSFVNLTFGLKNIPMCSLNRHDVQVEVDFGDITSLVSVSGSGSFIDSASYTLGDFRQIYGVNSYDINTISRDIRPFFYQNVIAWSDSSAHWNVYDTTKNVYDPTAYTRTSTYTPIPVSVSLNGYFYGCDSSYGNYLTKIYAADYLKNNDTRVTASVPAFIYGNQGFDGGHFLGFSADSRYVYMAITYTGFYLPINGTWTNVYNYDQTTGVNFSIYVIFYGITSISLSSGAGLEFIRRIATNGAINNTYCTVNNTQTLASNFTVPSTGNITTTLVVSAATYIAVGQYVDIPGAYGNFVTNVSGTTITVYITGVTAPGSIVTLGTSINFRNTPTVSIVTQNPNGSNCYTNLLFQCSYLTNISNTGNFLFNTAVNCIHVRYDTTQSINTQAAYQFYYDANTLFPTSIMPYFGYYGNILFGYSDGRYLYTNFISGGNYIYRTDLLNFFSKSGHQLFDINSLSLSPYNVVPRVMGPPFSDGKWIYFITYQYTNRVLIGSDFSKTSSWNIFDLSILYSRENNAGQSGGLLDKVFPSAFDGRYVYYSQDTPSPQNGPVFIRYDTTGSFSDQNSWILIAKEWTTKYLPNTNVTYIDKNSPSITDAYGNTYVTVLKTDSSSYTIVQANNQPAVTVSLGYSFRMLIKYDKNGNYLWYIYTGYDDTLGWNLRVDSAGYLYILGLGIGQITQPNGTTFTNAEGGGTRFEGQVIKVDQNGYGVWMVNTERYPAFGFGGVCQFYDITFDGAGNAYAVGSTGTRGFQGTGQDSVVVLYTQNALPSNPSLAFSVPINSGAAMIVKINSSGIIQFANFTTNTPIYPVSTRFASSTLYVTGAYSSYLQWYQTTSTNFTYNSITYSSSIQRFVAVTTGQTVLYNRSNRPLNFLTTTAPVSATYGTVVWSSSLNLFVSLGNGVGIYSSDGITWTQMGTAPSGTFVSSCITSVGIFMLNSVSTTSYYSASGTGSWTSVTMPTGTWYSVAANGSTVVAVGNSGTSVAVSTNGGISWTGYAVLPSSLYLRSITWAPTLSLWVAVGPATNAVYSSSPTTLWTASSPLPIITGQVNTIAGQTHKYGYVDGGPTVSLFNNPQGIASDGAGNLYIADRDNNVIRKLVIATSIVSTFAGSTSGTSGSTDGIGTAARFSSPNSIAYDGAGNLYVSDSNNNSIRKIVISTATVTTLVGPGTFNYPGALIYVAGNLYVYDNNRVIRKVVVSTGNVTIFAGTLGVVGYVDGTGTAAQFDTVTGFAYVGSPDTLYVCDAPNAVIRKIVISTAVVTTYAGTYHQYTSQDGTGASAYFDYPWGIAYDGSSRLYVTEAQSGTIRSIVVSTAVVTTIVGVVGKEYAGSLDGIGNSVLTWNPRGLTYDTYSSSFYFTEDGGSHVKKLSPIIQTSWNAISSRLGSNFVVAVGTGALAAYSVDGITWSPGALQQSSTWSAISYSPDSNYFAAISTGTNMISYSSDGYNWSFNFFPSAFTTLTNPLSTTTTMDGFLQAFTSSGAVSSSICTTQTNPTNYFWPSGLFVDSSGNIYICTNSRTGLLGSYTQIYLLKYSPALLLQWSVTITGSSGDQGTPYMVADSSGNIIFTFSFFSSLLTVTDALGTVTTFTKEPPQYIYDTFRDSLILKFSQAGALLSKVTITGNVDEFPGGLGIDSLDNLYWWGWYSSSDIQVVNADGSIGGLNFPTTGLLVSEQQGGAYTLLVKFNSSGSAVWGASGVVTGDDYFPTSLGTQMTIPVTIQNSFLIVQGTRYIYFFSTSGEGGLTPQLFRYDPIGPPSTSFISSMIVEYAHVSEEEVKYFRNTIQYTPFEHIQSMFVSLLPGKTQIPLQFFNLIKDIYVTSNTLSVMQLTFNGEDLFNFSGEYFGKIMPFETDVNMASVTPTYKYTFGTPVNFSRIQSKVLTITQGSTASFWIYAKTINVLGVGNGVAGLLFNSRQYLI